MSYMFAGGAIRPNKLTRTKDKNYHRDFARYCINSLSNHTYRRYIEKCLINWSFFKGGDGQWIMDEDVEAFFLDESGDIRNRLKWTKNVIKPMVQQYVGNAIRLSYNAKAECISDFVINEREKKLTEIKFYHKAADSIPWMSDIIREKTGILETFNESKEMFYNMFVENYEEDINNLVSYIAEDINIEEIKVKLARSLALNGLAVYKGFEDNEIYVGEDVNTMFFFWDMACKKQDLSDSEHMGEWYYMDSTSIYEKYHNLSSVERQAIEDYSKRDPSGFHKIVNGIYMNVGGRVPVYETYWKDTEQREFGWVKDEFGYPYYTLINHENSKYTDKDLIKPQTEKHIKEMKGKKKHKVYVENLRYCIFIPKEEIGSTEGDIILEYGEAPYQQRDIGTPAKVGFPYKCYTWVYDRGEVLTPLDDVIDPQRFLNRTISIIESHMSNMRGTGTVISKSAVDPRDGEADVNRNINSSKPIFVDTDRVGSVQNAIGTYGTNFGQGTLQMFQVVSEVQKAMQDVTGVNEAMTGTQGGADVLVGVLDAQIQRGSIVQEPFYFGLTSILRQAYEHMASVGKAVYFDNPRRLAMMVGDRGVQSISITEDHMMQDYRMFMNRVDSKERAEEAGNQLLFTLLQYQLIDPTVFSNLFGRATPDRIAKALRSFSRANNQAQSMIDKANMAGDQMANQKEAQVLDMVAQESQREGEMQAINDEVAHERDLEKIAFKEKLKNQE